MEYRITTEYRHAKAGELFVENGELRVSEGQYRRACSGMVDQYGEVVTSIQAIVKSAPRKRPSRSKKELVNA